MKTKKLKPAAKAILFVLAVAILIGVPYTLGVFDPLFEKSATKGPETVANAPATNANTPALDVIPTEKSDEGVIDLSLDEWIGWKPIVDANGGVETKPGSIFDKLGLKVNIHMISDATNSSTALIKGSLDAAGYTVNRYAFLYDKFQDAGVQVTMPYITNSSAGGDGIIAADGINNMKDLVGKSIAVPRFSEAQTLVLWLMAKDDTLTDADIKNIKFVLVDTPEKAAQAFFSGQVQAAATWQPYLSEAKKYGGHVLFDTKAAKNIILDGIVFRKDFVDKNQETVQKFIQGALEAEALYTTDFEAIKATMPFVYPLANEEIKAMTVDAALTNYAGNKEVLNGVAQTLFADMANIWNSIGEKANPANATKAFDKNTILGLEGKFEATAVKTPTFTEKQREAAKTQDSNVALLNKKSIIQFKVGSAEFADQDAALAAIAEFSNIAKILDGTAIVIEGNTDSVGNLASNIELSKKRADAIALMLKFQGIDPSRLITVGNGPNKPVADNGTDAGRQLNRRTEVFFKIVQ